MHHFINLLAIFLVYDLLGRSIGSMENPCMGIFALAASIVFFPTEEVCIISTMVLGFANWVVSDLIHSYGGHDLAYDIWLLLLFAAYFCLLNAQLGSAILAVSLLWLQLTREAGIKFAVYAFLLVAVAFRPAFLDRVYRAVANGFFFFLLAAYHFLVDLVTSFFVAVANLATAIRQSAARQLLALAVRLDPALGKPDPEPEPTATLGLSGVITIAEVAPQLPVVHAVSTQTESKLQPQSQPRPQQPPQSQPQPQPQPPKEDKEKRVGPVVTITAADIPKILRKIQRRDALGKPMERREVSPGPKGPRPNRRHRLLADQQEKERKEREEQERMKQQQQEQQEPESAVAEAPVAPAVAAESVPADTVPSPLGPTLSPAAATADVESVPASVTTDVESIPASVEAAPLAPVFVFTASAEDDSRDDSGEAPIPLATEARRILKPRSTIRTRVAREQQHGHQQEQLQQQQPQQQEPEPVLADVSAAPADETVPAPAPAEVIAPSPVATPAAVAAPSVSDSESELGEDEVAPYAEVSRSTASVEDDSDDDSEDARSRPPTIPLRARTILKPRSLRARMTQQPIPWLQPPQQQEQQQQPPEQEMAGVVATPSDLPPLPPSPPPRPSTPEQAQQPQQEPEPQRMDVVPPSPVLPQPSLTLPPPAVVPMDVEEQQLLLQEEMEVDRFQDISSINPAFMVSPTKKKPVVLLPPEPKPSPATKPVKKIPQTDEEKKAELERARKGMEARRRVKANPFLPKKKPPPKRT